MIPEDWEVKKIGEISEVGRGRVISHREISASLYSMYPVYSSQTFNNGIMGYIDAYDFEGEYVTWTTDGVNAGTVFYRNGRFNCTNVCGTIKLRKHNSLFVSKILGILAKRYVSKNLANPKLMNDVAKQILVPLPPTLHEQTAIAAALSDVDALIASLDQLIAKKRDIKQATMQQLLTGKTRLPGFSKELKPIYKQTEVGLIPEDWEVHTLGDEIDQLEAGVSVNSVDEEFHVYAHEQAILKTSAVSNGYFLPHENKKIAPREIKRAKLNPRVNSIVISRMNTLDLVGECGYVEENYPYLFLPDRLWMTRFKRKSKINVKWLSYLLSYTKYKAKIKEAATGTSGSMKNISKGSLLSINIPFPASEEQRAIANILSDMDAEIAALEQKRDKIRALNQGMMQELLTGKTRLL